jgi:nucleoside-diphosphate-sugar epimerase
MNVFVTGGSGYVGSVLLPILRKAGHQVTCIDRECLSIALPAGISVLRADVFDVRVDWLSGMDAVIHLAAYSNDKSFDDNHEAAWRDNVAGAEHLIHTCLQAGVGRFVLASTCSVYGFRPQEILDEGAAPHPAGGYSASKYAVEVALSNVRSSRFYPFILRKPTLHGWSPRMRWDMVVHSMVKSALSEGSIRVHNPEVWRPVLHVQDAAFAYLRALEAPLELAGVYNVHFANYRLMDIGVAVQNSMRARGWAITIETENRYMPINYRIRSEKIQYLRVFPSRSIESSVHEILDRSRGGLDESSLF